MPPRRFLTLALSMVVATLLVPLAPADHMQSENGRIVVFDHKGGNEWWVEVFLSGQDGGVASAVDAMDTDGTWVPLAKKSWGNWAASFHIEPGHPVRFRASWPGGSQVVSCWFSHPAGVEDCSAGTSPPFTAQFTLVTGNEWWVQTQATPNAGTVSRVDVRLDGGAWMPLQLQSWGVREWAASHHIVQGTRVQFQATDTAGRTYVSACYGWIPPQGNGQTAAVVDCAGPPFTATFSNVVGNPWWVEVRVAGSRAIQSVDVRVEDGAWRPLTLRSWGSWAASFQIPDGSYLRFRAGSGGAFVPSGDYVWPSARAVGAWPVEGSYANYRLTSDQSQAGGFQAVAEAYLYLRYENGAWAGACEGRTSEFFPDRPREDSDWTYYAHEGPPMARPDVQVGWTINPRVLLAAGYGHSCAQYELITQVRGQVDHVTALQDGKGRALFVRVWDGTETDPDASLQDLSLKWDRHTGMIHEWHRDGYPAHETTLDGWLIGTDAFIR
jgi:hypothetical protein